MHCHSGEDPGPRHQQTLRSKGSSRHITGTSSFRCEASDRCLRGRPLRASSPRWLLHVFLVALLAFCIPLPTLAAVCRSGDFAQRVSARFASQRKGHRLFLPSFCPGSSPTPLSFLGLPACTIGRASGTSSSVAHSRNRCGWVGGSGCRGPRACKGRGPLEARGDGLQSLRCSPQPDGGPPWAVAPASAPASSVPNSAAAVAAEAGAAVSRLRQEVEALTTRTPQTGPDSGIPVAEVEVESALKVLQGLTSLLIQMGSWRLIPPDALSSCQALLFRLNDILGAWEGSPTAAGAHHGPLTAKGGPKGAPLSPDQLLLLRSAWHLASAYLEATLQLQRQQQQQQHLLNLLVQQKAGDPESAAMLAEDLVLLQEQRSTCIAAVAARAASHLYKTRKVEQQLQQYQQGQQEVWETDTLLQAHALSDAEAVTVAAALVQQGVAAARVRNLVSFLFPSQNKQQRQSLFTAGRPSSGVPTAGDALARPSEATKEETSDREADERQSAVCLKLHLLFARAFADEGRSSEAAQHLLLALGGHSQTTPVSRGGPHEGPPSVDGEAALLAGHERAAVAAALAVAVELMKKRELERACSSLHLLPFSVSSRFPFAILPVALELSGRLLGSEAPRRVPLGGPQEDTRERLITRHFGFVLRMMRETPLWREGQEEWAAEALEQSQRVLADYGGRARGDSALCGDIAELLNSVYEHLQSLVAPPALFSALLSPKQQRLLFAALKALFAGPAAQRHKGENLLSLVAAAAEEVATAPAPDDRNKPGLGKQQHGIKTAKKWGEGDSALAGRAIAAAIEGLRASAERLLAGTLGGHAAATDAGDPSAALPDTAAAAAAGDTAIPGDSAAAGPATNTSADGQKPPPAATAEAAELVALVRSLQSLTRRSTAPLDVGSVIATGRVLQIGALLGAGQEETSVPEVMSLPLPSLLHGDSDKPAPQHPSNGNYRERSNSTTSDDVVAETRAQLLSVLRRHQQTGNAEAALLLLRRHLSLERAAAAALDREGDSGSCRGKEGDGDATEGKGSPDEGRAMFFAARLNGDCFYYGVAAAAAAAKPEIAFEILRMQQETGSAPSTRTFNAAIKACAAAVSSSSLSASPSACRSPRSLSFEEIKTVASDGFGVYRQLMSQGPFPNYNTFLLTSRLLTAFVAAVGSAPGGGATGDGVRAGPLLLKTAQDAAEAGREVAKNYGVSLLKGALRAKAVHQARTLQQQQQNPQQTDRQRRPEELELSALQQQILKQYTPWVHGEGLRAALLLQDYSGAIELFDGLLQLRQRLHSDLTELHQQQQQAQQQQEQKQQRHQQEQQFLPELPSGVLDVALRALDSLRLMGTPPPWASLSPTTVPSSSALSPFCPSPSVSAARPRLRRQLAQLAKGRRTTAAMLDSYLQLHDVPSSPRQTHQSPACPTQVAVGTTTRGATADAKLRLAKTVSIEGWQREYEALQQAQSGGYARLWLPDEEQIVKTLVRRFGGLAALEAIHQQLVQSEQREAQQQSCNLVQHRQQLRQQQHPSSRLQSLHANLTAALRVPSHAWVTALEHEVAQGAPDSVQAILELLGETAKLDMTLARQVLLPFTRTFPLFFFFGRFRYARASLNLFGLWVSLWREEGRTKGKVEEGEEGETSEALWEGMQKDMTHAVRLMEAVVRCTATAGRWHLSLEAVKLFLSSRVDTIPAVSVHPKALRFRSDLLHFFHSSVSRMLQLLAGHLTDHSLVVSRSLEWVLVGFQKACANWCAFCDAHAPHQCPSEPHSLEALLEQETAFAALEREIAKLMASFPEGLTARAGTAGAPQQEDDDGS